MDKKFALFALCLSTQLISHQVQAYGANNTKLWNNNVTAGYKAPSQITVTGTVLDKGGTPIIGANVMEQGKSTNGTITDLDGKFTLNVTSSKAVLVVSFIGYAEKQVSVNKNRNLQIVLEENSELLKEVVVVAYGTQKKSLPLPPFQA